MPRITIELLRKRSEHNEGVISTLEEISLHQEELEKIEVIGTLCRKLRILYLQNNIIEKIEDLTHMKELRYLNLALNNISKIEGLQACEFLEKLDLTVNFIDFDELEASVDHLKPLQHLRELYMLGNPCQHNWEGFNEFMIASLPQLRLLDGKEVHRSDRIKALQVYQERLRYVREQAVRVRAEKARRREEAAATRAQEEAEAKRCDDNQKDHDDVIDVHGDGEATDISTKPKKMSVLASDEKLPYTPDTRRDMYLELAEQKEEEEARRRENQPRERNMEVEYAHTLHEARRIEAEQDEQRIRQCNEGKWDFRIFDEDMEIILEVDFPRFLDTSMIDVDVHPSYVSIVAKNKLFRLRFPELVHSDSGKAERSKVTGTLKLTLPKAHTTPTQQLRAQLKKEEMAAKEKVKLAMLKEKTQPARTTRFDRGASTKKLSDEILAAAQSTRKPRGAVNIRGLVKQTRLDEATNDENHVNRGQLKPLITKMQRPEDEETAEDEDAPPLIF